jgi:serine/threonine-protein kinase
VHRDIKPANLFLAEDAQGGVTVKVCDFGIAKSTATDGLDPTTAALTKTGGMLGSPIYMSPEQARNAKQVDARSDVWSLSISMHEALVGTRPWSHCTTIGELILGICTEDVRPLRSLAPWVDADLAEVVHRGLARGADRRWPDVASLEKALAPFAGNARLTREMLRPLPPHVRAEIDAHAKTVAISSATTSATSRAASVSIEPKPKRTGVWLALGAAAIAIVGVTAYVRLRARADAPTPASDGASPSSSSSGASSASDVSVSSSTSGSTAFTSAAASVAPQEIARVAIVPADAKVTVDGVAHSLVDGVLSLEGEPGAELRVVVTAYGRSVDQVVVLGKGGLAHPDKIVVAKAGPPAAPGVAKSSASTAASKPPTSTSAPTAAPAVTIKEGL